MKNIFKLLKDVIIFLVKLPLSLLSYNYLWCLIHHNSLKDGEHEFQKVCSKCGKRFYKGLTNNFFEYDKFNVQIIKNSAITSLTMQIEKLKSDIENNKMAMENYTKVLEKFINENSNQNNS